MSSEALSEIPGHPVVSVAGTVPGEQSQHAVIGWAEATAEGAVLGLAIVMPDRIRVFRSEPVRDMVPFPRQRLGIWTAMPASAGRVQLAVALQSRVEPRSYGRAVFDVGPGLNEGAVTVSGVGIAADKLHSAVSDYEKNVIQPFCTSVYLTDDGSLWADSPFEVRRRGIELDSPLPAVTTGYRHWGVRAADGTITFEEL